MKKLLALLLVILPVEATGPIEVSITVPPGYSSALPSAPVAFNLTVRGCDSVSATINSTNLGVLNYPYRIAFNSVPSGANTIVIVGVDYRGTSFTNTVVIPVASSVRYYPRRLFR